MYIYEHMSAVQCVQAAQLTFEDFFMADMNVTPLKIVGVEGFFGSLIMIVVLLPLVSVLPGEDGSGLHESTRDTLHVCFLHPASSLLLDQRIHMYMALWCVYNLSAISCIVLLEHQCRSI